MATKKVSKKQLELDKRNKTKVNSILYPSDIDNSNSNEDAYIVLKGINKIYDNDVQAVFDFNLNIKKNEFIVFVGPSGCGKSTTLRMVAGLEEISSGELFINKRYSNNLSPKDRDIAMVFQTYALYPHMSVKDNLAFGLKIRKFPTVVLDKEGKPVKCVNTAKLKELNGSLADQKVIIKVSNKEINKLNRQLTSPKLDEDAIYVLKEKIKFFNGQIELATKRINELNAEIEQVKGETVDKIAYKHMPKEEIKERVAKAARILEIEQYLDRKPKALSGGQRQRVALGRAIVRNASAFLMDEPLSNLDAKLRVQMRSEIVSLHKEIGSTTIYVTHDQTEAMTMADRIVVMKDGVVQQIGTPREIYNNPKNLFVATFIGAPAMNILNVSYNKGKASLGKVNIKLSANSDKKVVDYYSNEIARLNKVKDNLTDNLRDVSNKRHNIHIMAKEKCEELLAAHENNLKTLKFDTLLGIRPEDVSLSKTKVADGIESEIKLVELLGSEYYVHVLIEGQKFTLKAPANIDVKIGDKIYIKLNLDKVHLIDKVTDRSIY